MDNLIKFPVQLKVLSNKGDKQVVSIHSKWKQLNDSASVAESDNYGVLTGSKNQITVIDFNGVNEELFMNSRGIRMFNIQTPSGGVHFYFQYEEKLKSIYNTMPGVSVINDGGCAFFGTNYRLLNNAPITKMPQMLFDTLYEQQTNRPIESVDQEIYELFDILSDEWFERSNLTMNVIHALRNQMMADSTRLATIRQLLFDRSDCYHERLLEHYLNSPMNSQQTRITVCGLTKLIKRDYPEHHEEWFNKWKAKKVPARKMKMKYKEGGLVKLSDLKAIYNGNLTASILIKKNIEFTISKKNICKSCQNIHKKGCCDHYQYKMYSTCNFVNNVKLV